MVEEHVSMRAWHLLRRLESDGSPKSYLPKINPNLIANRMIEMSRAPSHKQFTTDTKEKLSKLKKEAVRRGMISAPFTLDEINIAITKQTGKSTGVDEIFPEFYKHFGPHTRVWLVSFFNNILENGNIPPILKNAKIIAVCKPGKPKDLQSYRSTALLSITYKLLERLILNRISPIIDQIIPVDQAGFRPNRSCTDQIAALTSYVENGCQCNMKTTAVWLTYQPPTILYGVRA